MWVLSWLTFCWFVMKFLPQKPHAYRLSPRWARSCWSNEKESLKFDLRLVNKWRHGQGGQLFCDDSTMALILKSVTRGRGVNLSKFCVTSFMDTPLRNKLTRQARNFDWGKVKKNKIYLIPNIFSCKCFPTVRAQVRSDFAVCVSSITVRPIA